MTCEHAHCHAPATVKTRFGDGTCRPFYNSHQTFVSYCDAHYQHVASLFHLCHVTVEDRPNGPSR